MTTPPYDKLRIPVPGTPLKIDIETNYVLAEHDGDVEYKDCVIVLTIHCAGKEVLVKMMEVPTPALDRL